MLLVALDPHIFGKLGLAVYAGHTCIPELKALFMSHESELLGQQFLHICAVLISWCVTRCTVDVNS